MLYQLEGDPPFREILLRHRSKLHKLYEDIQGRIADWHLAKADKFLYEIEDIFDEIESELGKKMLLIFFLGAFLGDLLSLFAYPFTTISIGASAGVFALMGAGILIKPFDLSFYPLIVPIPLAFLGILYAIYNVYGFIFDSGSNISYIAHFGGLAVGLYYGFRIAGKRGLKIIGSAHQCPILIRNVRPRRINCMRKWGRKPLIALHTI